MLYLCATPIGNLEDITLRVLRILREADTVFAEDTRRTLQLLNHFQIKKPLVSCHTHNERERAGQLTALLEAGKTVAYCSDAGMPGISDPGERLVRLCVEKNLPVTVLPGASAVLMALVLSGLDCAAFSFMGFPPRDKKQRRIFFERLRASEATMLLYESPARLPATLRELCGALGEDRPAAVLRELTKLHETVARGTLAALCGRFCDPPRGECVIAIAGAEKEDATLEDEALDKALQALLESGLSPRDAAAAASALLHVPKKKAYQRTILL